MRRFILSIFVLAAAAGIARGQVYTLGADPVNLRWKSLETEHFRLVYPEATDSLAREYAKSLESFVHTTEPSIGFYPNQFYKRKMPVIFHAYSATSNGMVSWAPRRMELFTNADLYDPESTPWMTQLTVHEGRHVAQMQFPRRNWLFGSLEYLLGDLSTGAATAIYPGQALMEGDAVAAETALTDSGRGRTSDFLEYYHVALSDSLYRDFWQWRYGSQKRYTPDYYRAGYVLVAGMRTAFNDTLFTRRYFHNVNARFLPFFVLYRTVEQGSWMRFDRAFKTIQDSFRAEWAAADSARAPFVEGQDMVQKGRLYDTYISLTPTDKGFYAIHGALDKATELVRIDSAGKVRSVVPFSSQTSRLTYDRFYKKLIWSEHRGSAMLELKSYSMLRYMNEDGTIRDFKVKGRFFNPSANDIGPTFAAVQQFEDGHSSIKVFSSSVGTVLEEFRAPAGLQPVEIAWIDGKIYASAITEEGFSIYDVDGWRPLFAPAHSKINRLFGRDGLIWFSSDRSGVPELHSVDPASGEMLQRTSLRFGGKEFAFGPDSSLWYSAPTAEAKIVRRLEPGKLLAKPVTFNAIQIASAEKLSAQEGAGSIPYEGPISEGKRYSKLFQPVRFHSWMPVYVEYNPVEKLSGEEVTNTGTLGATVLFQNELGTSWGSAGVSLVDSLGFRTGVHAQFVSTGLGPTFELRADYYEEASYLPSILNLVAGVSFPINLSKGGWRSGIIPSYKAELSYWGKLIYPWIFRKASLTAYTMRPVAPSGIFPKWGIGVEMGMRSTSFPYWGTSRAFYGKGFAYLPGLMSTHGIKLSGEFVRKESYLAKADYAFPFLPLDWSRCCPAFYVRNLEGGLHGAVEKLPGTGRNLYAGASLKVRLANLLWSPYDTYFGVKYLHCFNDPSRSMWVPVLSVNM
ncbi:MAG: hypothetical protein IKZ71_06660 [Bacteroidales bacterium]|nr:hypothetical protein [Bacteroidales bacterium]